MTKQTPPPPGGVETDLNSGEFFAAIVMAATWFFLGPWGIIPTIWFAYMIADARPELLATGRRLLPAPVRNHLAEMKAEVLELGWRLPGLRLPALAQTEDDQPQDDGAGGVRNSTGAEFTPQTESAALPTAQARPGRRPVAVLSPEQFAEDPLFRTLNEEPHRLVIGHSTGGKTTAMHGMAMAWAGQGYPVYVLDPDAANGQWPGATVVAGYAEDYDGIGRVIDELQDLFDERSELFAEGQRDFDPVHIVADEVHETIRNVPAARDFLFETVGRRGAKRGIFLTLGTQGNNVDELSLDSAGVLNNFITAELEKNEKGRRIATVYRGNAAKKKRLQQFAVPPLPGAKTFIQARPITQAAQLPLPEVTPVRTPTAQLVRRAAEPAQVAPRPTPVAEPMPDLLAELLASPAADPRQADRQRRLEALLAQQQTVVLAEPPPTAHSVTVEREGAGDVNVIVHPPSAPKPARKRREGAVNVRDRQRRLERKTYYEQAAREGVSLTKAYEARPAGEKGDYNEASMWYRAAKARIIAS